MTFGVFNMRWTILYLVWFKLLIAGAGRAAWILGSHRSKFYLSCHSLAVWPWKFFKQFCFSSFNGDNITYIIGLLWGLNGMTCRNNSWRVKIVRRIIVRSQYCYQLCKAASPLMNKNGSENVSIHESSGSNTIAFWRMLSKLFSKIQKCSHSLRVHIANCIICI